MTDEELSQLDTVVTDMISHQILLVKINDKTSEVVSSEMVSIGYAAAVYEKATGKEIGDFDGNTIKNQILVFRINSNANEVVKCEFVAAGYSAVIQQYINQLKGNGNE
ncbi:MAG: hypothetical protein JEZ06_15125 [Anaerolineaceae bacterium]|nr:hypothetical protein [Anaerolineaceae bacterium]